MIPTILGRGRDVYHGNGKINWKTEKATNHITWAMTKVSQSLTFTDSLYLYNKAGMRAAALVGGGYHYADPGASPTLQARRFLSLYQPTAGREFVCLDLEKAPASMTQRDVFDWRRAYSSTIRTYAPGVGYGIYLGGYSHNGSGASIADECDWWMYPEYPGIRSFPSSYTVHVSAPNMTGKVLPEIWQCSDNIGGLDGSVSIISAAQLAHPRQPTPTPAPHEGAPEMFVLQKTGDNAIWISDSQTRRHLPNAAAFTALVHAGAVSSSPVPCTSDQMLDDVGGPIATDELTAADIATAVVAALPPVSGGAGPTAIEIADAVAAKFSTLLGGTS